MGDRADSIGIKQVVRVEWYDYALDMMLDGRSPSQIRAGLDEFIRDRRQSGGYGERGDQTYVKAVTQIMKSWVQPDRDLVAFRDEVLQCARLGGRGERLALHWAVTVAAYPFWHHVAFQVGRLLNLQNSVTQSQIRNRCFEALGERSTVERSARRVIRTFVAWGVLLDSEDKGIYRKGMPMVVSYNVAALLFKAALMTTPEGRAPFQTIAGSPALFPFTLPLMSSDSVLQHARDIEIVRLGGNDDLLKLVR